MGLPSRTHSGGMVEGVRSTLAGVARTINWETTLVMLVNFIRSY
jgi:phage shock protein PspC (stress-responsive transcriptional regulator)